MESSTNQPKLTYKGSQTFRHDLFRLEPADLKRNTSFKAGEVKLETISHSHFFHTFDSNGRPQQYSTPTGGHFHEVKWRVDEDGEMVAECGPALRIVYQKRGGMQKKKIVQVKWDNAHGDDDEGTSVVTDAHKHNVQYAWSEELSADTIRKRRTAQEVQARQEMAEKAEARKLGLESGLE